MNRIGYALHACGINSLTDSASISAQASFPQSFYPRTKVRLRFFAFCLSGSHQDLLDSDCPLFFQCRWQDPDKRRFELRCKNEGVIKVKRKWRKKNLWQSYRFTFEVWVGKVNRLPFIEMEKLTCLSLSVFLKFN